MSRAADADADFIAQALPAFVAEAREQVASIEQLLLELEADPADRERLDALFRCAHTVKGSAGIFGLDRVVAFAHHVETLLDRLREGRLALDAGLGSLLLACNDEILALVSAPPDAVDEDDARARRAVLVERLRQACGDGAAGHDGHDARDPQDVGSPGDAPGAPLPDTDAPDGGPATGAAPPRWRIDARFGPETFRNGMDPLAVLGYLRGMGTLVEVACEIGAVPALDAIDPECCHLAVTLTLETAADSAAIESAFSFVRDDCELRLQVVPGAADRGPASQGPVPDDVARSSPIARADTLPGSSGGSVPGASARDPGHGEDTRFIRVQADRLDAVINLLGELVIAAAGASELSRHTRQGSLIEANQQVGALIEEIRNSTLQLRMVPIGETFARFRRVVRDTAAELGKDVALEIAGGDTELDKSVVERIVDPLMHVVRNALDHGLESPAERVAAGKPARGRLALAACHEAGSIVIRVDDDGRGIRRDKVLQRAWDRGLVERGVEPSDDAILQLVFAPGFSTADTVTNLSGRGVGMDVVRRNIESVRGSVALSSEPGRGARVEIRLPLTLAIIDGFLVGVGASRFVMPLDAVVEVIEDRDPGALARARGRGTVELRGRLLPVLDLREVYGLDGGPAARGSIVVVQAGAARYGVIVDQLLGQHQTVIKPLGRMFRALRGMSGSTILGNGDVALIFDPVSLGQLAAAAPVAGPAAGQGAHGPHRTPEPAPEPAARAAASLPSGIAHPQLTSEGHP